MVFPIEDVPRDNRELDVKHSLSSSSEHHEPRGKENKEEEPVNERFERYYDMLVNGECVPQERVEGNEPPQNFSESEEEAGNHLKPRCNAFMNAQEHPAEFIKTPTRPLLGAAASKIALETELLPVSIQKEMVRLAKEILKARGYVLLEHDDKLDALAIKVVKVKNLLDVILLVPLKACNLKGVVIVKKNEVDYISHDKMLNMTPLEKHALVQSRVNLLEHSQDRLFSNMINQGRTLLLIDQYLQEKVFIEKTMTKKRLFLRNGRLQYKIIINPILMTLNEPGFTEKSLSFPYQKGTNIHFIAIDDLIGLLGFLERKYRLIETHSVVLKNSVETYFNALDTFISRVRWSSVPLLMLGSIFILVALVHLVPLITLILLNVLSIVGFVVVMILLWSKFTQVKSGIKREWKTPYYQQPVQLGKTELMFINNELSGELMEQFLYECYEKDINAEIMEEIERSKKYENNRSKIKKSLKDELRKLISNDDSLSSENDENQITFKTTTYGKKPEKKDSKSYSSFLET